MPEVPCQSLFLLFSKITPFWLNREQGVAARWKFYVSPSFHLFSYGRSGIKGMEQVFKDRMELYHPHTPVQITDKALSVSKSRSRFWLFSSSESTPKKAEGLLDFVDVRGAECKLQAQIVFQLFIQQIVRVLGHKVNACVHGTVRHEPASWKGLALCHL